MSELPSVVRKNNNTIHNTTEIAPLEDSKKSNGKLVLTNFEDRRQKRRPKFELRQIVRTADI